MSKVAKIDIERKRMKLICCGQWKTATKSCSAALKILGYNPCDFMDTMSKLSKQWLMYMDGKITTRELIEEYEARGFDCNQDIPGNYYWEELYNALGPDTKVILTVRDNTERWWHSYLTFFTQETERSGCCGGFNIGNFMTVTMDWGLWGSDMKRFMELNERVLKKFSDPAVVMKSWSVKKIIDAINASEDMMKRKYEAHNAKVIATIPPENLLVWNLKEGWEPLCTFLARFSQYYL